ncbi:MAG: hypothetical protein ACKOWF_11870, partial [Chloroflexota bacterium]
PARMGDGGDMWAAMSGQGSFRRQAILAVMPVMAMAMLVPVLAAPGAAPGSALSPGVAAALAAPGRAGAQEATVEATACTVAPRSPREVARIAGTPEAAPAAPAAAAGDAPVGSPTPRRPAREPKGPGVPLEVTLPEGPPAPEAAVAGMTATMRQFTACYSAGEALRMMALVTDEYLRGGFAGRALSEQDVVAFAGTPRPMPPAEQRTLAAVRGARQFPDGRVAALFDLAAVGGPAPGEIRTDFVVFREVDGAWLIESYAAGLPPDRFGPGAGA